MTLTMPDFPAPVVPPISACQAQEKNPYRLAGFGHAEFGRPGNGHIGGSGPRDRRGVRVFLDNPQREPVRARGIGNDPDAARPHAQPGFNRGYFRNRVFGRAAFAENDAGGPTPRIPGRRRYP